MSFKDVPNTMANNGEELVEVIKLFVEYNPILETDNPKIIDLYNHMYDKQYIKHFARTNFTNVLEMQEFYYKFINLSRVKQSLNSDIYTYPSIIAMLWDGINGWQW